MLFLYTHKSVPCQVIINEATHQQAAHGGKEKPQIGSLHWVLPLGAWGSSQKKERKKCKRQNGQGHQESTAHRFQLSGAIGAHSDGSSNHRTYMDLPYIICICYGCSLGMFV